MKMQISPKISSILEKELALADYAIEKLEQEMSSYEKKYDMTWYQFMKKFDKGELGDDSVFFDWYSLALGAKDWDETKKEISKIIRPS